MTKTFPSLAAAKAEAIATKDPTARAVPVVQMLGGWIECDATMAHKATAYAVKTGFGAQTRYAA